MIEKTEWEIVDSPPPNNGSTADGRKSFLQVMQNLLGPWWRWKVAGATVIAVVALAFFAAVIGMIILIGTATAVVGIGASKLRQWGRQRGRASTPVPAPRSDRM